MVPILWSINMLAPSWQILYPKVLELSLRLVGFPMFLCPMLILELFLSGSLTASEQGSLTTTGEFLNISALDPLLPTFLIATLCLCALSVITYYSLAIAWEVFWASWQSPSPLDPSAEVVLTVLSPVYIEYILIVLKKWYFFERTHLVLRYLANLKFFQKNAQLFQYNQNEPNMYWTQYFVITFQEHFL